MNILPLVFAVLLILGVWTHALIDDYKRHTLIKKEYLKHITEGKEAFNQSQIDLFHSSNKNVNTSSHRRINFYLILNKKAREADPEKELQHEFIAKELIEKILQNNPYFEELKERRPRIIDELIEHLKSSIPENKEIRYSREMYKLKLEDDELQTAFYFLLKGVPRKKEMPKEETDSSFKPILEEVNEEVKSADDQDDIKSKISIISLMDFIHFNPKKKKIQIYLAPRELLLAIFANPDVVNNIIEKREELFIQLNEKQINLGVAEQAMSTFKLMVRPEIKKDMLDFNLGEINPKNYR